MIAFVMLATMFVLASCRDHRVQTSICPMGERFAGWQGTLVRFHGLITKGDGHHYGPQLVDTRCWRGIAIAWRDQPALEKALETRGLFNVWATVEGRIVSANQGGYLLVGRVAQLQVYPQQSKAVEDAFFRKMLRLHNAYYPAGE